MDKIRKFTQKCMDQIAAYTSEKGAAVRDFGIALDVEQKAAMELMRRIHSFTQEELNQKSQAIGLIEERIQVYDSSLEELIGMTGRVQENLNRIRDESAFVEDTYKQIVETRHKMEQIEKNLNGTVQKVNNIEQDLQEKNAKTLGKIAETVLAEAQTRFAEVEAGAKQVEHKIREHREALAAAEQDREAALARDIETLNNTLKEAAERAANNADKMEDAAFTKLREQAQERLSQLKDTWEETVKSAQDAVKNRLVEIQGELKNSREEWKKDVEEIRQQKDEVAAWQDGWEGQFQGLSALAVQQGEALRDAITIQGEEFNATVSQLLETQKTAFTRQKEELARLFQEEEQKAIAAAEERLDEYRQVQTVEFNQLGSLINDTARLEGELRNSMQDVMNRVSGDFTRFEEESVKTRETAVAQFDTLVQSFRLELEGVNAELNGLRARTLENVSKKLSGFEDDFSADLGRRRAEIDEYFTEWLQGMDSRLAEIAGEGQKAGERGVEEQRNFIAEQGTRLTTEMERLKHEAAAFEEGIREAMRSADETRRSFGEQLQRDMEEIRGLAENEVKLQISRHNLSVGERLRQNQRELEEKLAEFAGLTGNWQDEMEAAQEQFRRDFENRQSQHNAQVREIDQSIEELRKHGQEASAENEEYAAQAKQSLEDISKEVAAQVKRFDQTNELKLQLEGRMEELSESLDRLDERKNEIAQLEGQFAKIKHMEDEVNAKLTRFFSEKNRIELLEKDFNRLLEASKGVEEKLTQVTVTDDTLQNIQVEIRRLEAAFRESEEKYQRIEGKSQILEETNKGIERNFKALQESEENIKKSSEDIEQLSSKVESLGATLGSLSIENDKIRDTTEKMAALDESLAFIEKRITEMNTAREWLARTETELRALDKDAQAQLRLTRSLLDKEAGKSGGKNDTKGAPSPRDRDNIIKLRRQGWTVEEIAKTMDISKGEVELILEISPKDN